MLKASGHSKVPQALGVVNGAAGGLVGKVLQALGGTTSAGKVVAANEEPQADLGSP